MMENTKLIVSYPPYTKSKDSIEKVMYTVVFALLPAVVAAVYFFGLRALALIFVCSISAIGFEYLINVFRKQEIACFDGSALVTGILLALNLPSNLPYWMAVLGSFVAIVVVKQLFGGLGFNVFNPALAARVFLLISFPVAMTIWPIPFSVDMQTAASPLGILKTEGLKAANSITLWQAFIGNVGGSLGETSALALLLGSVILFWKKYITWIIPVSFVGATLAFTGIFHYMEPLKYASPAFHFTCGGLLLGALFMATDMVTTPVSKRGQLIFGLGCGLLTGIIRLFGGYPEGVSFAILIMNAFVPLLDKWDNYSNGKKWRLTKMRSVIVLTCIGFFSAFLLYMTDNITKEPIKKAIERVKVEALRQIFPFEFSDKDINIAFDKNGKEFFEIKNKDNSLRGIAVETSSDKGYGGEITILVAVSPDGKVFNYNVLSHKETPGLGNKIENEAFKKQFNGKTLDGFNWKVKKDDGFVDELTAATISSRAATDAVKKGLEVISNKYFVENKK